MARELNYSDLERLLEDYERDFEGLKGLRLLQVLVLRAFGDRHDCWASSWCNSRVVFGLFAEVYAARKGWMKNVSIYVSCKVGPSL